MYANSCRSTCKHCQEKIDNGELRIGYKQMLLVKYK